jgi:asparaginyl-tRNA synthetase
MEINDGACFSNIQVIANNNLGNYSDIEKITIGTSLSVTGSLVESPGKGQKW